MRVLLFVNLYLIQWQKHFVIYGINLNLKLFIFFNHKMLYSIYCMIIVSSFKKLFFIGMLSVCGGDALHTVRLFFFFFNAKLSHWIFHWGESNSDLERSTLQAPKLTPPGEPKWVCILWELLSLASEALKYPRCYLSSSFCCQIKDRSGGIFVILINFSTLYITLKACIAIKLCWTRHYFHFSIMKNFKLFIEYVHVILFVALDMQFN